MEAIVVCEFVDRSWKETFIKFLLFKILFKTQYIPQQCKSVDDMELKKKQSLIDYIDKILKTLYLYSTCLCKFQSVVELVFDLTSNITAIFDNKTSNPDTAS